MSSSMHAASVGAQITLNNQTKISGKRERERKKGREVEWERLRQDFLSQQLQKQLQKLLALTFPTSPQQHNSCAQRESQQERVEVTAAHQLCSGRARESWSLRESHWSLTSLGSARLDSALSWKKVSVCAPVPVCVFGLLLSLVVAVVVFTFASLRALLCLRRRLCAVCQCLRRVSYNLYSPLGVRFSRRAVVAVAVVAVASPTTRRVGCIAIFSRAILHFAMFECSKERKEIWKIVRECFVKCIKNLLNYLFATRFTYSFVCPNRETQRHIKQQQCVFCQAAAAFGHIRCV